MNDERVERRVKVLQNHIKQQIRKRLHPKVIDVYTTHKRKITIATAVAAYSFLVIYILRYMRKRYRLVIGHLPLFAAYFDQVAKVSTSSFTVMEPIVAMAMMSAFSVLYKQVRSSMVTSIANAEQDLILQNGVHGVMSAFIRGKGEIPHEAIHLVRDQSDVQIYAKCEPVDDYMKLLQVSCFHPRTGQKIESKCLIPVHDTDLESFEITDISQNTIV